MENENQPEITPDGLGNALDDLIKAAEATDLVKGGSTDQNRVEHSGTRDEDGAKGGGRGSYPGDAKVDNMMIGKLANLGFSADQIAAMSGALKGKQDDEEEEDDNMEGYLGKAKAHAEEYKRKNGSMKGYAGFPFGKSDASADQTEEPLAKSIDQFRSDETIVEGMDAIPFLEQFVTTQSDILDGITHRLAKGFGNQDVVNKAMAAALHQTGTLLKSQSAVIDALSHRLGIVERQPNPQKGVTSSPQAALHKSMPGESGKVPEQLTKSETLAVLSYMNLEKGERQINGQPTSQIVGLLEAGGQIDQAALTAVQGWLEANPNESKAARSYR